MGRIISSTILTTTVYENYLNSIRYLIDPSLTIEDLPNEVIDSLAYLEYVEDVLIKDLTGFDPNNPDAYSGIDNVRKLIIYRTALELLYKFPQILQETELQESVRYAEIDFDMQEKNLLKRLNPIEEDLDIIVTTTSVRVKSSLSKSRLY